MNEAPGFLLALGAGLLSFLSPCVLPLIPGYLSFISGEAALAPGGENASAGAPRRRTTLARTLVFTLGFTVVFTALGIIFGGGSALLGGASAKIATWAGILIVLFGLNILFDFVKFLNFEKRVHPGKRPSGLAGSFLVGVAFGAGWTPCVGPMLASILLYAGRSGDAVASGTLLAAYSLGLALPFLAAGAFLDRMKPLMNWFKKHALGVRVASGTLLVLLGIGMALGQSTVLNGLLTRAGFSLAAFSSDLPGRARAAALSLYAVLAALVSVPPLLRGRPFARVWRLLALALLAVAAFGEVAGLWSGISVLAGWLSFQGA
jgi:cytochrome c-type biogenesis protein